MRIDATRIDPHPVYVTFYGVYVAENTSRGAETGALDYQYLVFAKAKRMFKSLCKSCGNVENRRQDSTFEPFFDGLGQRFYRSITVRPRVRYRSGPLRRVLSPSL